MRSVLDPVPSKMCTSYSQGLLFQAHIVTLIESIASKLRTPSMFAKILTLLKKIIRLCCFII